MENNCVCSECGNEQDTLSKPCYNCGSVKVILISVAEELFGLDWKKSFIKEEVSVSVPFAKAIPEKPHCENEMCNMDYFGCCCECDMCLAAYGQTKETYAELKKQQHIAMKEFAKKVVPLMNKKT